MSDRMKRVSRDEWPDRNAESVPDDIVEYAISTAVRYGECPKCGEQQFYLSVPNQNGWWSCQVCEAELLA